MIKVTELALIQLGGAIASSVIVKQAGYFSRLGGHKFDISSSVRIFCFCLDKIRPFKASHNHIDLERGQRVMRRSYCCLDDILRRYPL